MSKALQVFTCIFTDVPPGAGGSYNVDALPSTERNMYNAVLSSESAIVATEGSVPFVRSMCYAGDAQFQTFLAQVNMSRPFIAIMGTFPGNEKRYYTTKNISQVGQYLRAMYLGEFGGTGLPTNPGDADGGWGTGDGGLLCKLLPPLCALGFLPWLALAAVTTYKAAESRSTVGRAVWGVPAGLLWLGFFERGGVKQIQWWVKKAGIGKIYDNEIMGDHECLDQKWTDSDGRGSCSYHGGFAKVKKNKQYEYFSKWENKWVKLKNPTKGRIIELQKGKYKLREV